MKHVSPKKPLITLACLTVIFLSACGPSQKASNNAKRYPLKGKIVSVDKQSRMVNVDAEAIPGFMDAMTMPYKVKPESELDQLSPGASITADLVVLTDEYWLENVKVTQPSPPKPVAGAAR